MHRGAEKCPMGDQTGRNACVINGIGFALQSSLIPAASTTEPSLFPLLINSSIALLCSVRHPGVHK